MHDEDTSLIILFKGSLIGQQTFEFFYSVGFFTSSHLSILKKKKVKLFGTASCFQILPANILNK